MEAKIILLFLSLISSCVFFWLVYKRIVQFFLWNLKGGVLLWWFLGAANEIKLLILFNGFGPDNSSSYTMAADKEVEVPSEAGLFIQSLMMF